ncbi:MAG: YicC/YloC family endoribonuclease [bacterium]
MTGYGAGQATRGGVLVRVEMRSVNHRFLDPALRISRDYQGLEDRIRERLRAALSRGRVTVSVDVETEGSTSRLVLDESLAAEYLTILRILEEKHHLAVASDSVAFAQLPDLVRHETPKLRDEDIEAALDEAMDAALGQLDAMRKKEGEALRKDLAARLDRIDEILEAIERAGERASERTRDRISSRVASLVPEGIEPDTQRLATEIAILAEKADVTEEIVRFRAHTAAMRDFLGKSDAVGRRMDFLLQEMNREGNTIGSKSSSAEIAHLIVEAKEEIERLREQVQNVE